MVAESPEPDAPDEPAEAAAAAGAAAAPAAPAGGLREKVESHPLDGEREKDPTCFPRLGREPPAGPPEPAPGSVQAPGLGRHPSLGIGPIREKDSRSCKWTGPDVDSFAALPTARGLPRTPSGSQAVALLAAPRLVGEGHLDEAGVQRRFQVESAERRQVGQPEGVEDFTG